MEIRGGKGAMPPLVQPLLIRTKDKAKNAERVCDEGSGAVGGYVGDGFPLFTEPSLVQRARRQSKQAKIGCSL